MPLVKIKPGLSHRGSDGEPLKAGDVFDASPAEMESFGDKFEPAGEDLEQDVQKLLAAARSEPEHEEPVEIDATLGARKLAQERNVVLSNVVGTGKDGKITKADVVAFLNNMASIAASLDGNVEALISGDAQR